MTSASNPVNLKLPYPRPIRSRRPPTRLPATTAKAKTLALQANLHSEPDKCPPAAKKEKPKSETYKRVRSISEQHLLERLLAEIPGGEKNRWSKISKAMGVRRTPRHTSRFSRHDTYCIESVHLRVPATEITLYDIICGVDCTPSCVSITRVSF
ncbi:hypothetical protein EDB85DRAFT_1517443 [Lactarius pseudohatsudake]|nr:hypothetical protein EDB85DRAFT_1517443 [Lactarius pseudohatsudake]